MAWTNLFVHECLSAIKVNSVKNSTRLGVSVIFKKKSSYFPLARSVLQKVATLFVSLHFEFYSLKFLKDDFIYKLFVSIFFAIFMYELSQIYIK